MQRYKGFQPTGFDRKGIRAEFLGIADWYVAPVTQNRDSGTLERSNFACFLEELGGESDTVQVHRFGHWACGWFEIIVIDPTDEKSVATAEDCENSLADYPILNEEHHSELEYNEACENWERMSVRDRVEYLQRYGRRVSIFAARRDELPQDLDEIFSLAE